MDFNIQQGAPVFTPNRLLADKDKQRYTYKRQENELIEICRTQDIKRGDQKLERMSIDFIISSQELKRPTDAEFVEILKECDTRFAQVLNERFREKYSFPFVQT